MATTPDSHAGGLGFESRCCGCPTKVWSPNPLIPLLQVANTCQGSPPRKVPCGMVYAESQGPRKTKKYLKEIQYLT